MPELILLWGCAVVVIWGSKGKDMALAMAFLVLILLILINL